MPSSTNQLKALRQKLKLLLRSRLCFTIYLVLTTVLLAFGSLPVEANTFLSGCNGAILSWSCVLTVYNFIFAIAASMAVVALGWWGFILTVPGIDQNRRFTGIQHFRSVIIGLLILGSIFAIFNTFSGNLITNRPGTESLINPGGEPITAGEQPAFIPSSQNKKNYQASQQASQNSSGSSTTSEKEDKKGKLAEKIARVLKDGQKDNNIENVVFSEKGALGKPGSSGNGSGSDIETGSGNGQRGGNNTSPNSENGTDGDNSNTKNGSGNQEGDDETDPVLIPKLNKQPKSEAGLNKNIEKDLENRDNKEEYSFERVEPTSRFPTADDLKECIGDDQATDLGCINNLQINENIQIEGLTQEEQKSFVDWATGTAEKVGRISRGVQNVAGKVRNISETWGLGGMGDIFGKIEKGARTAGSVAKKVERGGEIIRDIKNGGLTYKQLRQITDFLPPGSYKQKYVYPAIKTAEDIEDLKKDLKKEGKPTTFYGYINHAKNTADIIGGLPVIGPTKTANKVIATLNKAEDTVRYTEEIPEIVAELENDLRNSKNTNPEEGIPQPMEFKIPIDPPPIVQVQDPQLDPSSPKEYQVTSYEIGDVELTPLSGNNIYAVIEAIPCTHRIGKTIEKCKTQDPETYFVELQPDKNSLTSTQNSEKTQKQLTDKLKGQRYAGCLFGPESAQKLINDYLMPALLGVCPKDASIDIGDQSYRAQVLQGDWRQTT